MFTSVLGDRPTEGKIFIQVGPANSSLHFKERGLNYYEQPFLRWNWKISDFLNRSRIHLLSTYFCICLRLIYKLQMVAKPGADIHNYIIDRNALLQVDFTHIYSWLIMIRPDRMPLFRHEQLAWSCEESFDSFPSLLQVHVCEPHQASS